jgi:hypothetical protein
MGVEHVIAFPNLFTYYEQDMAKSIIFLWSLQQCISKMVHEMVDYDDC